jgi:hypothetical protein
MMPSFSGRRLPTHRDWDRRDSMSDPAMDWPLPYPQISPTR